MALHGLEQVVRDAFPKTKTVNGKVVEWVPTVIRYADDFVVCHRDLGVIHQCQSIIEQWLKGMGLELKPSKTRISHSLHPAGWASRFSVSWASPSDNIGWGSTTRERILWGRPLGFKNLITPSKTKVVLHRRRLAEIVRRHRAAPQEALIAHLNPIIRGWCNYYRTAASKETFHQTKHRHTLPKSHELGTSQTQKPEPSEGRQQILANAGVDFWHGEWDKTPQAHKHKDSASCQGAGWEESVRR